MAAETPAQRYARDWAAIRDDRDERGLFAKSQERKDRDYVDRVTGESAVAE